MRRNSTRGIVFLIVGVGLIIWGVYSVGRSTASCGGETMRAGDTCVETKYGVPDGVRRSVSQELANEHEEGWGGIGVGAFLLVVGGLVLVSRRGRRAMAGGYGGGGYGGRASFPAGPPAGAGWAPGQQPYGQPGGPGYVPPGNQGFPQPGNPGYGQQQGWGQPPQYPPQGQYPQR
jgi:hypothetical protein